MGTLSMVLELKKGDRVYIKHPATSENNLYSEAGSNFSMFSGYFICEINVVKFGYVPSVIRGVIDKQVWCVGSSILVKNVYQ
jgi:hypothetical protein